MPTASTCAIKMDPNWDNKNRIADNLKALSLALSYRPIEDRSWDSDLFCTGLS